MCEPRRLTTLWAFTACYRDSITLYNVYLISINYRISPDIWEFFLQILLVRKEGLHTFWSLRINMNLCLQPSEQNDTFNFVRKELSLSDFVVKVGGRLMCGLKRHMAVV
jgi:hypothetical protein